MNGGASSRLRYTIGGTQGVSAGAGAGGLAKKTIRRRVRWQRQSRSRGRSSDTHSFAETAGISWWASSGRTADTGSANEVCYFGGYDNANTLTAKSGSKKKIDKIHCLLNSESLAIHPKICVVQIMKPPRVPPATVSNMSRLTPFHRHLSYPTPPPPPPPLAHSRPSLHS